MQRKALFYATLVATLLGGCGRTSDIPANLDVPAIADEPVQSSVDRDESGFRTFTHPDVPPSFQYNRVASYEATALVVVKKDNVSDPFGEPVPLDLVLAWGPFADTTLLEQFNIKLHKRYFTWRTESPSFNDTSVYRLADNLANTHFIASSPEVFDEFRKIPEGTVVRFTGFLVNVKNTETGGVFKSSTTRRDSGWGACEVVEVTSFEVIQML